jgi:hypothetical protein
MAFDIMQSVYLEQVCKKWEEVNNMRAKAGMAALSLSEITKIYFSHLLTNEDLNTRKTHEKINFDSDTVNG